MTKMRSGKVLATSSTLLKNCTGSRRSRSCSSSLNFPAGTPPEPTEVRGARLLAGTSRHLPPGPAQPFGGAATPEPAQRISGDFLWALTESKGDPEHPRPCTPAAAPGGYLGGTGDPRCLSPSAPPELQRPLESVRVNGRTRPEQPKSPGVPVSPPKARPGRARARCPRCSPAGKGSWDGAGAAGTARPPPPPSDLRGILMSCRPSWDTGAATPEPRHRSSRLGSGSAQIPGHRWARPSPRAVLMPCPAPSSPPGTGD